MIHLSHSNAIFSGGNYSQVNNTSQQSMSPASSLSLSNATNRRNGCRQLVPWDRLQSAAAPSAFYDSDDHFDAPKCHPNTRIAVMNELRDFVFRRGETGPAKILWLSGPAGAGKTAIARSLCEECSATDSLLASFFFNRSDAHRNTHKSFVATISYQICGKIPPQYQSLILDLIERDPLVFTRSVDAQFKALILVPLRDLFVNNYFNTIGKRLIVIDGLDECSTSAAQINILTVIQEISKRTEIPFIFLIASRPENEIQAFFRSSSMVPLLHRLHLNCSYNPDKDIERFLRDKLQETCDTHPFKDSIPYEWPSNESIRTLVRKSSGQFIYASLAVKYVTSNRHHPPKRLEVVLKLRPPKGDLPFAELDALYSHIFSRAEDINLALLIIGYVISDRIPPSVEELARIDRLDPDDCLAALCDLYSVLSIKTNNYSGERYVHISHKSLPEYLCDSARCGKYHINTTGVLIKRAAKCMQYISDVSYTPDNHITRQNIIAFFHRHLRRLVNNISVSHEDLMSFSLLNCYNTFSSPTTRSTEESALFIEIFWDNLFFSLLDHLRTLVGTDYAYLYDHYLSEFRKLISRHPDVYRPSLTKFNAERVAALVTVLILTEPSGSAVPLKFFASTARDSPTSSELGKYPCWFWSGHLSNLFHDGALHCFKYLKYDVNPSSVAATLRYLTWVLPYAAPSSELEAACNLREPFAHVAKGDPAICNLAQEVATAMKNYRKKIVEEQHLWDPDSQDNSNNATSLNGDAPENEFTDSDFTDSDED